MKVIIDARHPASGLTVFSISLLERNLRLLALSGIREATVIIAGEKAQPCLFRRDFGKFLPIRAVSVSADNSFMETVRSLCSNTDESVILLEANAVYQDVLIRQILERRNTAVCTDADGLPALLTADGRYLSSVPAEMKDFSELRIHLIQTGLVKGENIGSHTVYIESVRKYAKTYAFYVTDPKKAKETETFLFEATHYGSIDFVAKYALKHLSKVLVSILARTTVTPNQITYTSILCSLFIGPLAFFGYFHSAVACALLVAVLDVCDGKLARFTYRSSNKGDKLDHVADTLNIYIYYFAFGAGLYVTGLIPTVSETAVLAGSLLLGLILDRIVARFFHKKHGMRIHDFAPIDSAARLFLPRRNVFVFFMATGLIFNVLVQSYTAYIIWKYVYVVFHFVRYLGAKPKTISFPRT